MSQPVNSIFHSTKTLEWEDGSRVPDLSKRYFLLFCYSISFYTSVCQLNFPQWYNLMMNAVNIQLFNINVYNTLSHLYMDNWSRILKSWYVYYVPPCHVPSIKESKRREGKIEQLCVCFWYCFATLDMHLQLSDFFWTCIFTFCRHHV